MRTKFSLLLAGALLCVGVSLCVGCKKDTASVSSYVGYCAADYVGQSFAAYLENERNHRTDVEPVPYFRPIFDKPASTAFAAVPPKEQRDQQDRMQSWRSIELAQR